MRPAGRIPLVGFLRESGACADAVAWAAKYGLDYERAWEECGRADWMMWFLERTDCPSSVSVAAAIGCAREVLHLIPEGEDRPRLAVEAAEAWLKKPCRETKDAAYAAYAAFYAANAAYTAVAAAARKKMQERCADIVRLHTAGRDFKWLAR